MLFTLASCAALLSLAAIPPARAANINVKVGGVDATGQLILAFDPPSVNAAQGDVINFVFDQKNHTATQSTFDAPCTPKQGGFDSGFVPVTVPTDVGSKTAVYTVADNSSVWVYCRQGNHCQSGMVFAINPTDAQPLSTFQSNAKSAAGATPSAASPYGSPAYGGTGATPPASTGTPPLSNVHQVVVGGPGQLLFSPSNITASPGDMITFTFKQKNHTVTQSTFASPCSPKSGGFDSGFHPVPDSATTFSTWNLQVNDTNPIWAYCQQANHCASGMVFSVNSVESSANNFAAFKQKAMSNSTSSAGSTPSGSGAIKMSSGAGLAGILLATGFVLFS